MKTAILILMLATAVGLGQTQRDFLYSGGAGNGAGLTNIPGSSIGSTWRGISNNAVTATNLVVENGSVGISRGIAFGGLGNAAGSQPYVSQNVSVFSGRPDPTVAFGFNVFDGAAVDAAESVEAWVIEHNYYDGVRTNGEAYVTATDTQGNSIRPIAFTWDKHNVTNYMVGTVNISTGQFFSIVRNNDNASAFTVNGDKSIVGYGSATFGRSNSVVFNDDAVANSLVTLADRVYVTGLFENTAGLLSYAGASLLCFTNGNLGVGTQFPSIPLSVPTGPVGLGTTSSWAGTMLNVRSAPGNTLNSVFANANFNAVDAGSGLLLDFGAATGNTYSQLRSVTGGGGTRGNLVMQTDGGNVGIGTASPAAKLDVNGGAFMQSLTLTNSTFPSDNSTTNGQTSGQIWYGGTSSNAHTFFGNLYKVNRSFVMGQSVVLTDTVVSNSATGGKTNIYTIPMAANYLTVGKVLETKLDGLVWQNNNAATLVTVQAWIDSTNLLLTVPLQAGAAITAGPVELTFMFTCRSIGNGTSASVVGRCKEVQATTSGGVATTAMDITLNPVTFDSTVNNTINITVSNTVTGGGGFASFRLQEGRTICVDSVPKLPGEL